ncbi:MAG: PilZ domain-containing protein [Phycisphaeraceae bacterium]
MPRTDLEIWIDLLSRLSERNETLWITQVMPEQPPAVAGTDKCRVLAVNEDGSLTVERNLRCGEPMPAVEATVNVLAFDGTFRWAGTCTVESGSFFRLNEDHAVRAAQLSAPTDLHSAQRRDAFRVQTTGAHVVLHNENNNQPIHASLLDISVSGMSVQLTNNDLDPTPDSALNCRITLPSEKQPLTIQGTVARTGTAEDGATQIGVAFCTKDNLATRRAENAISRFAAWLQRQSIAGRKRA